MGRTMLVVLALVTLPAFGGERLQAKIVKREPIERVLSGRVRGSVSTRSRTSCIDPQLCLGSTTGTIQPAAIVTRTVSGAKLTLLLPDGRYVLVSCDGRYAPRGDAVNQRNCRIPPVDDVQVEFNRRGTEARIYWPASLDGKKLESEKYDFLAQEP